MAQAHWHPMRQLWLLCWCLALLLPGAARAQEGKLSTFPLNGFRYIQLDDWAKHYRFTYTWTKASKEAQITSKWSKLEFEVDSKRMVLNGVAVWLSAPVVLRSGSACISTLDLDNAIHAVMFPPKIKSGDKIKTICIDPGHGGKDPGNQNSGGQEKGYTLLLAKELKYQLETAGFKVVLTRTSDKFVELESRPFVAQKFNADLFISLHFNGVAGGGAKGAEVFALTPPGASSTNARGEGATAVRFPGNKNDEQNGLLSYYIQRHLLKNTGAEDRGVRRARFAVLRYADMPAVLVEAGFMSDPGEASKIRSSSHRRLMAKGIVEGIKEYKRIVERE
jgi:N-acetylmuramoyl-L-alanine amidase